MIKQRAELTYKHNLKQGRHGWLRLTLAYSIRVVHTLLEKHPEITRVLDPFSGTGTTGLVSGERGASCDLLDINPYLVWFAQVKTANYPPQDLDTTLAGARDIVNAALAIERFDDLWIPPISHIERWWSKEELAFLAKLHHALNQGFPHRSAAKDLLLVAFCRLVIQSSKAAFNHQSMSFKDEPAELFRYAVPDMLAQLFNYSVREIVASARMPVPGQVRVKQADSRCIPQPTDGFYNGVLTSPPYPNRMSYIRELRPYMYWLGYLNEAREAAELDWQAIGGTWGVATSRLLKWESNGAYVPHPDFDVMIERIRMRSELLANYVHKYFVDISAHLASLYTVLEANAKVFYIVGNSKFYETIVPVEEIYANLLRYHGFTDVAIETLRKRNSKKELLEFVVSARKPG